MGWMKTNITLKDEEEAENYSAQIARKVGRQITILNPILDFIAKPDKQSTFEDLLDDCLQNWIFDCNADYEHAYSDEAITDMIQANDYKFTKDGEMY